MKKIMDCTEVQKKIHNFISNDLESKETVAFISHIQNCEKCREELSIEYLVVEGLQRLDSASAFDLQGELDEKMNDSLNEAKTRIILLRILMGVALIGAIVGGYFLSTLFYF